MKKYEMSPTEENLIETLYKDTIDRNKDIVYFYNILQAQESASTIAIDGRWGSCLLYTSDAADDYLTV